MLLDKEEYYEREDREVRAERKATLRTKAVQSVIAKSGHCSSFGPSNLTDVLYVFGGNEHFAPPETHSPEINRADRPP